MPNMRGKNFNFLSIPKVGEKQWTKKEKEIETPWREIKCVTFTAGARLAFSVTLTSGEDIFFSRHREREKENTQGTEGWSRLRDRTLAVKSRGNTRKSFLKTNKPRRYVPHPGVFYRTLRLRTQTSTLTRVWQYWNILRRTVVCGCGCGFLAQAACVRHACLRAPCLAWPLLAPLFSLFSSHISSSYAKILEDKLFRTREIPQSGSKAKNGGNTPGGRDRTLAVKSRKNVRKITIFSLKNKIYPPKIYFFAYIF